MIDVTMSDTLSGSDVVHSAATALDAPSAVEFMREALIKISEDDIAVVASLLEQKHQRLVGKLQSDSLTSGGAELAEWLLRQMFATRRRSKEIIESTGPEEILGSVRDLIHGDEPISVRFNRFDSKLSEMDSRVRHDFAGECLRFSKPDEYWLWARWMWDPMARTGALPLVLVNEFDFDGANAGEVYERVGNAITAVVETADALGFGGLTANRFAVDVYLAAIYGVYLYTVTRMRMTQEFNKVIPNLPELVRRLLGVYRLEN